jgi:outer membrane protein OmpA-like peptidoglycan-associated protein
MRFILLICLSFLHCLGAIAQNKPVQLGKTSSDCLGALAINDTVVGPVYSPQGYGNKLEIEGYELGDPFYIQREHNTVWYKFTAPYDAVFSFDLVPVIKDDDFDFLLFKYDGPNFCKDVSDGRKIPIRTNISRKNTQKQGYTGLSESAVEKYVPSGPGSPYSSALNVRRGDVYYLLVDNPFRENEGHSIFLRYRKLKAGQVMAPEPEPVYVSPVRKLRVTVTEEGSGERLASDIFIEGGSGEEKMRYPSLSQVEVDVVSYRTYSINVVKKGYLLASETFIPKNDSMYDVGVTLKEMKLGDRINLQNIKFDSDKTEILPESQSALDQLKAFMDVNPQMHIELQGHVNGESKRNKKKYRKLSAARADAIYTKLVEAGVDKTRISVVGFGNARMIFPTPVNNRQAEANRRVEAEVTKL